MPAQETRKTFTTFKEAFCHRYGCPPEKFEGKVLFKCMQPFRAPLALPLWWFNKAFFATDIEAIQSVGITGRREAFAAALDNLYHANKLDRSIRRGILGIRVSGSRLMALRKDLDPWLDAPSHRIKNTEIKPSTAPQPVRATVSTRKLREVHTAVTHGAPIESAAEAQGFTLPELREALAGHQGEPAFAWLARHLGHEQRLAEAEAEITGLRAAMAAQSAELVELRRRLG
jgi:hypothetical protein